MRFDYVILHVSGKYLYTADVLSRAPLKNTVYHIEQEQVENIEFHMRAVVTAIPASNARVETYCLAQAGDTVCSIFIPYCKNGWLAIHFFPDHTGNSKVTYL